MKLKIKNKKKFVTSTGIILSIILFCLMFFGNKVFSSIDITYKTIIVSVGDTLWSIAKEEQNNNEYYKEKDIRYIIHDLKSINKLQNINLKSNQKLIVPII